MLASMRAIQAGAVAAALVMSAGVAQAQSVISAQAGTIHHIEGAVLLDGQPVKQKFGDFPSMKRGAELRTEEGRAEVLLTVGTFLRLAENTGVRLVSNSLLDTKVELLSGSILLECAELPKDAGLQVLVNGVRLEPRKTGLFRYDADTKVVRVYDGELAIVTDSGETRLKAGRELRLEGQAEVAKFDKDDTDSFYNWTSRRASYISAANVSAAYKASSGSSGWASNGWGYNPYFGLFTFIPRSGIYNSPFGYSFYSPSRVMGLYQPVYVPDYGNGNWGSPNGMGMGAPAPSSSVRSGGYSMGSAPMGGGGGGAAAPAPSATPGGGSVREGGVSRGR